MRENDDRQHFMYVRVKNMSDNEYRQFIKCRQTKIFSVGVPLLLGHLGLARAGELTKKKFVKGGAISESEYNSLEKI